MTERKDSVEGVPFLFSHLETLTTLFQCFHLGALSHSHFRVWHFTAVATPFYAA